MNLVSWNSAIQIKKRSIPESSNAKDRLWHEVARPACYEELIGNEKAIQQTESWFQEALTNRGASSCLFVHGESGTGKSTAVSIIAQKHGFQAVTTYADRSRTPARLEGVFREASLYGSKGVVVLDDFEIFLFESTSLRVLSKLLRQLLSPAENGTDRSRCLIIIISNSKHKIFGSLQDISTIVRFETLRPAEIHTIFNRLAARVRHHSYVPPMASYLSSVSSSGTITQGVQQLQLLFTGNTMAEFVPRPRRKKQKTITDPNQSPSKASNNRDCISYLWSDVYTDKILEHLVDEKFNSGRIIERLIGFERGRLDIVGHQLHDEYARRMASTEGLRHISDVISMSDTNRIENHQDGLYEGENRDNWSANDIAFVSFIASGVVAIKEKKRKDACWSRKSHVRLSKCYPIII